MPIAGTKSGSKPEQSVCPLTPSKSREEIGAAKDAGTALAIAGAVLATGYVLGSLGGGEPEQRWHGQPMVTGDYAQHASERHEPSRGDSLLAQFDGEIDMLRTAAIATLTAFLRSTIREYVPAMGQHLDTAAGERTLTPSTSPGASMCAGMHTGAINYEGIPETTSYGSNRVAQHTVSASEGQPQRGGEHERSVGASTRHR
ncbi:MAG: hypothetical protein ACJ8CR_07570 [Roseiflexaceae bacterium]